MNLAKAFASFVNEFSELEQNFRLLIVGDGPERTHFEQLLPDGVFTGLLDGDDLAKAYASGDIFFNPSVTETFGNVTLEAMASGLPVIGAAATGSKSLIENANTGYVAEPTADSFADTLQDLVRATQIVVGLSVRMREPKQNNIPGIQY